MTKQKLPDCLTVLRIVLSVFLVFISPVSFLFMIIYLCAGISDMLDGYLARKLKCTSKRGAVLDSVADIMLFAVAFYKLIPLLHVNKVIIGFLIIIAVIKTASLIIAYIRFKKLGFIHTYMNKLTGLLAFCTPVIIILSVKSFILLTLCMVAFLAATEELYINMRFNEYNSDRKSFKQR